MTDPTEWIDAIFSPPSSPLPRDNIQPSLRTYQDDQGIKRICEYLKDFSNFQSATSPVTNASSTIADRYERSATVGPILPLSVQNASQPASQEQLPLKSGAIEIETQPREKFRPRTEKESLGTSHYIRCEDNVKPEHPSVKIPKSWQNRQNLIKVTLLDKDKNPHPYMIENKERRNSKLIFKTEEPNSLFFLVTDNDIQQGQKIFLIEFIKLKQNETITKEAIRTRQLYQSMLCFQRYYLNDTQKYQLDSLSTAYSTLMTEDFGTVSLEDVFPLYGPMSGETKVCVEFKGILPKDFKNDIRIQIVSNQFHWLHPVTEIRKNGTCFLFLMPKFPGETLSEATVAIQIIYREELFEQCDYLYTGTLDKNANSDYLQCTGSNKRLRQ